MNLKNIQNQLQSWFQPDNTRVANRPAPTGTVTPDTPKPAAPQDQLKQLPAQGRSQTRVSLSEDTTPSSQLSNIDSPGVYFDGNAASAAEIDGVLRHYGSPHAGQGALISQVAQEENINPILLLAVMQQESSYGNKNNNSTLDPENIANPWSVHFNESAQGINKLRLKDGSMPSFEQSLRGAVRTLKNLAGDSSSPLSNAGRRYSTTGSWTSSIKTHYSTQLRRISNMR